MFLAVSHANLKSEYEMKRHMRSSPQTGTTNSQLVSGQAALVRSLRVPAGPCGSLGMPGVVWHAIACEDALKGVIH